MMWCPIKIRAQTIISVNFKGGDTVGLGALTLTGASPYTVANWNNVTGATGSNLTLKDSTGAMSPVMLTAFSGDPDDKVNGPDTDNSTAQKILFGGSVAVHYTGAEFTVSGLSAFSSYSLVVYYTGGNSFGAARTAQITASGSGSTFYVAGNDSVYTNFIQSNSTSNTTYASGNYVVFSGLTDPTELVSIFNANNRLGLVGFQIIGDSLTAVPEPSSVWAAAALASFLLLRYRPLVFVKRSDV